MHQRQLIRENIKDILIDAATPAADRVYESRVAPLFKKKFYENLPAIVIYTSSTSTEIFNEAPRDYKHSVTVQIEVVASANEDLDDLLDDIAKQIEQALYVNNRLPSKADPSICAAAETILRSTQLSLDPNGETFIGSARLEWEVWYWEGAPEGVATEAFEQLNDTWNLDNNQHEDDQAEDQIELDQ